MKPRQAQSATRHMPEPLSYASIMVHIDLDEASPENRIWLASGIAEQFGATLIGISGCMPVMPAIGSDDTDVERQKIATAIAVKEQLFARLVKDAQHPKEWRFALDSPNNVVPREARAADLVVIGKDRTSNDPTRAIDLRHDDFENGPPGFDRSTFGIFVEAKTRAGRLARLAREPPRDQGCSAIIAECRRGARPSKPMRGLDAAF